MTEVPADDSRSNLDAIAFLVTPPGFSEMALEELKFWQTQLDKRLFTDHEVCPEGLSIETNYLTACQLNHILKVPSRILVRIREIRCKDFAKLERIISKTTWNDFIGGGELQFNVSSHGSRLFHKRNIEESATRAFLRYRKGSPPKATAPTVNQTLYLRFLDDTLTMSLDLSGEHLHKRGYKKATVAAPIRENLASGLLWKLLESDQDLPTEPIELIDAMAGSGTFGIEASLLSTPVNNLRPFPFAQTKPIYSGPPLPPPIPLKKICFIEKDPKAIEAIHANWMDAQNLPGAAPIESHIIEEDYFNTTLPTKQSPRWMIINPPYGERLKTEDSMYSFFGNIIERSFEVFNCDRMGILLPSSYKKSILDKYSGKYICIHEFRFKNSGLPLFFLVFKPA